jgi:hypothetical protein
MTLIVKLAKPDGIEPISGDLEGWVVVAGEPTMENLGIAYIRYGQDDVGLLGGNTWNLPRDLHRI